MKVVVTATNEKLDSQLDPRFGRCNWFLLVETDDMTTVPYKNGMAAESGGAGIQSAQFVSGLGATAVITGSVGPNAFRVLDAAGLKVYSGGSGSVEEAVQSFLDGKLRASSSPSAESHAGMRGGMGGGMGGGM